MKAPRRLLGLLPLCLSSSLSCSEYEASRRLPHVNPSPEEFRFRSEAPAVRGAYIGIEVEANETDSLENLQVLPGARVVRVERGSPADRAGIRGNDVLLAVDGIEIGDADSYAAATKDIAPGQAVRFRFRRDTTAVETVFEAASAPGSAGETVELFRIDPLRTRASYRTGIQATPEGERIVAVVAELAPESPLRQCGIEPGDAIITLEDRGLRSAQDLVTRLLEEHGPGDVVRLARLDAEGGVEETECRLWAPPRRLTRLSVPILFAYDRSFERDRTSFRLLDLWLLSLFAYDREGEESEYSLFGFRVFGTGYGALAEEPAELAGP